jgi:hypothetical protein
MDRRGASPESPGPWPGVPQPGSAPRSALPASGAHQRRVVAGIARAFTLTQPRPDRSNDRHRR